MAEKRIQAPAGIGGLVRYSEEEESLIKLKPEHVLIVCGALVVMEILFFLALPL